MSELGVAKAIIYHVSNEMTIDLNVFSSFMKNGITDCDGKLEQGHCLKLENREVVEKSK